MSGKKYSSKIGRQKFCSGKTQLLGVGKWVPKPTYVKTIGKAGVIKVKLDRHLTAPTCNAIILYKY